MVVSSEVMQRCGAAKNDIKQQICSEVHMRVDQLFEYFVSQFIGAAHNQPVHSGPSQSPSPICSVTENVGHFPVSKLSSSQTDVNNEQQQLASISVKQEVSDEFQQIMPTQNPPSAQPPSPASIHHQGEGSSSAPSVSMPTKSTAKSLGINKQCLDKQGFSTIPPKSVSSTASSIKANLVPKISSDNELIKSTKKSVLKGDNKLSTDKHQNASKRMVGTKIEPNEKLLAGIESAKKLKSSNTGSVPLKNQANLEMMEHLIKSNVVICSVTEADYYHNQTHQTEPDLAKITTVDDCRRGQKDGAPQFHHSGNDLAYVRPLSINPAQSSRPNIDKFKEVHLKCLYSWCMNHFDSVDQLDHHLIGVHQLLPFRCPLVDNCGQSFKSKEQLDVHVTRKHCHLKYWQCDICSQVFPHFRNLCGHMLANHYEGFFECAHEGCGFFGPTRGVVIDHFDCVHMPQHMPYSEQTYPPFFFPDPMDPSFARPGSMLNPTGPPRQPSDAIQMNQYLYPWYPGN